MVLLFSIAIFVAAALLFVVQPMSGRVLLPLLGGSPGVWNACMVFFQSMLLLGYLYSHLITTYLPRRAQLMVHVVLIAVAGATLPMPVDVGEPSGGDSPLWWLLQTLTLTAGLPFFAVSTSGPLLQRWFSTTGHPSAKDPYFLYAASNAGSFVGLFAYPLVFEPILTRRGQSVTWTVAYGVLGALVLGCVVVMLRNIAAAPSKTTKKEQKQDKSDELFGWRQRLLWVALAFVPSSLMLGVTQHISTDIAAIPLLWIVPLGLYLLSFVIAYSPSVKITSREWARIMPFAIVAAMMTLLTGARQPISVLLLIHFAAFFVVAMTCHKRLAELRPSPERLTEYYLIMSVGGMLGGLFNSIAGPQLFNMMMEYPLVLGLSALLRPQIADEVAPDRKPYERWLVGLACGVGLLLLMLQIDRMVADSVIMGNVRIAATRAGIPVLICVLMLRGRGGVRFAFGAVFLMIGSVYIGEGGLMLHRERTFFGEHRVVATANHAWHRLSHGTTLHGLQARSDMLEGKPPPNVSDQVRLAQLFATTAQIERDEGTRADHLGYRQLIPTTYYHPSGPIGAVMKLLIDKGKLDRVGLIGMGTGTLAAYAVEGSRFTFFEIDPAVVRIASNRDYFTYITDALRDKPDGTKRNIAIGYEPGDGRLSIKNTREGPFRLIVLDAFASDAIPVHLLTKEAVQVYLNKLEPDGLLAFHISNRYFDLTDPLQRVATELGLHAYWGNDDYNPRYLEDFEGKKTSLWIVMCRNESDFMPLARLPTWKRLPDSRKFPLWTDDYSNLLQVMVQWW